MPCKRGHSGFDPGCVKMCTSQEPCEVTIKNRMSLSALVAPPPFFELHCTLIGPLPKRPALKSI